ncbi:hypothetical protein Pan216_04450 [Planctomycetes bacterium Pan216]|uniref:YhcG N-terminal domain-containing protein n=1 Tax=Kolteria novifilia TaxID=2527975 RepID=A0A518AY27_9BACT|nr:hypothetical protein Pan216_04450 [Planctomycetes bacterium Pan216]
MTKKRLPSAASSLPSGFTDLLGEVKLRIQTAQTRAMFSVNAELIRLYWDIGRLIEDRQQREGWGASVIPRLSAELRNELPEIKGFSQRNIGNMIAFYRAYPRPEEFLQQAAAKLPAPEKVQQAAAKTGISSKEPQPVAQMAESLLWTIPWYHHFVLLQKVKDLTARRWYMERTLVNGWSRNVLTLMIESEAHRRTGKAVSNFERQLLAQQSDLVQQTLKDPYIFDFLTLDEPFHERELETALLRLLANSGTDGTKAPFFPIRNEARMGTTTVNRHQRSSGPSMRSWPTRPGQRIATSKRPQHHGKPSPHSGE